MTSSPRIIVGLSGGVDSSLSALLLKQQGWEVHGLFMKNWEEDDQDGQCAAEEDLRDARAVCDTLDIPLHTVNFATEYWDNVFAHCLEEYRAGRTPNPDVLCNREIKFKTFLEYALGLGGDRIATGHYARIRRDGDGFCLLKGLDPNKDQSYFLYMLGQTQLSKALFPVGGLPKGEVRRIAARAGLATHAKKDSTGICFIGERHFREFLQRFIKAEPGAMTTPEGRVMGRHQGLSYYTLGQRQGLGIGGSRGGSGEAWYVAAKDSVNNRLIVVQGKNHPLLLSTSLQASELHWVTGEAPTFPLRCRAKIRYRQADQDCLVTALENTTCRVEFEQAQWAVTPGQSVVFYQGEVCLGGGIIL